MKKSSVALVKCGSYEPGEVAAAVGGITGLLGGLGSFAGPGKRVFVKPNLLMASPPDRACTTHPEVLIAVIRILQESGARVSFGDLPGGFHVGGIKKIHEATGMAQVAEATGAALVRLEEHGFRKADIPGARRLKHIHIPKFLDEVDALVSVSRLKTHMQTLLTGAVKNLFGIAASQDRIAPPLSSL